MGKALLNSHIGAILHGLQVLGMAEMTRFWADQLGCRNPILAVCLMHWDVERSGGQAMGGRAAFPRAAREEILEIEQLEQLARRSSQRSVWLVPLPMVAIILVQTILGVVWLDNRLAPIALIAEQQKLRDDRIAELARRIELIDDGCRRYEWKAKP
jgi:hypothetical protein